MPRAIDTDALESPNMQILDLNNPPTKNIPHQSFPKMVYLHPKDKTKEHRIQIVQNVDALDAAKAQGWQEKPHVPVAAAEDLSKDFHTADFETTAPRPFSAEAGGEINVLLSSTGMLEKMSKSELISYAQSRNISIDGRSNQETIIAAIRTAEQV